MYILLGFSLSSLVLTGVLVRGALVSNTQHLIVEFQNSGRFEVVYTHHEFSEAILCTGIKQVHISRTIGEPWKISFCVQKLEINHSPVYVYIKQLNGDVIYNTVLAGTDGYLHLDCSTICDITI